MVGRDEVSFDSTYEPDDCSRRCEGGRGCGGGGWSLSLQSSMTVRRLDCGLDSEPYSSEKGGAELVGLSDRN